MVKIGDRRVKYPHGVDNKHGDLCLPGTRFTDILKNISQIYPGEWYTQTIIPYRFMMISMLYRYHERLLLAYISI